LFKTLELQIAVVIKHIELYFKKFYRMVQPLQHKLQNWPCLLVVTDSDVWIDAGYQKVPTTVYWQKVYC